MKILETWLPKMTDAERAEHEARRDSQQAPVGIIVATFAILITAAVISWVM